MMYTGGMGMLLAGFDDELQKLAAKPLSPAEKQRRELERDLKRVERKAMKRTGLGKLRGKSKARERDYLASAAIASLAYPLLSLTGVKAGRLLRNRATMQAMKGLPVRKQIPLKAKLEKGPLIARSHLEKKPGQISREDLAVGALRGGIVGSLLMAIRDRFAGSVPMN